MISIRTKLTLSSILLLALFMGCLLVLGMFLLEGYYVLRTRAPFLAVYEELQRATLSPPEALAEAVRRLGAESGYKLMIADRNGAIRLSSAPEFKEGSRLELPKDQREFLLEHLAELEGDRVLYGALDRDPRGQAVVQLVARIGGGDFLVVTQPLKQLRANSQIAGRFLLILGVAMLALGATAVLLLSGRATRPILDITGIASAIARMDFSPRYRGRRRDELGTLGKNINTIAERLSGAIGELQAANEQMRHEMLMQKRFLASVTHDFKTPIGLIRGYAESLELGLARSKSERGELAGIIITEADRLNALVNDITFMVRMDSHAITLERREVNVREVLQAAAARCSPKKQLRGLDVRIDAPAALVMNADEQRIMQVLDNLLSNALRHTSDGGTIWLRACSEANGAVRTEVLNTGEPIAAEHLPHLFEPFYRVDDARSKERGGSGLGLAIVQGIVAAHGGACGALNTPEGVLFWFTVPAPQQAS